MHRLLEKPAQQAYLLRSFESMLARTLEATDTRTGSPFLVPLQGSCSVIPVASYPAI